MLYLKRIPGESITIFLDDTTKITVMFEKIFFDDNLIPIISLGIDAPKSIKIVRSELKLFDKE